MFTDVGMPGTMDGIKLSHYIRNCWPPVKLIVTSGKMTIGESHLPMEARFFPKPYNESAIVEAMRGMLPKSSNRDPLDLVEGDFIAGAVKELRRAWAGMVGHRLGVFGRAAIGEEIREPGRAERMAAHVGVDAGLCGAPADHGPDVERCIGSAVSAPPCQSAERNRGVPFAPNRPAACM